MMNGFSPVAEIIANLYDCSPILVQLQTIIFIVVFIPSNFVVIAMLNKFGLRFTLMTGALMLMIGGWLRFVLSVYPHFWIISFGTAIAAFG